MGTNPPTVNSVTNPSVLNNSRNIFSPTAGLPAVIKQHDRNSVVIAGRRLGEMLEKFHGAGVKRVELIIEINGRQIAVAGSIYKKTNKRTKQSYYYVYPLGADQVLLREKYLMFRGAAESHSKTPLPVIVYSVMPKI